MTSQLNFALLITRCEFVEMSLRYLPFALLLITLCSFPLTSALAQSATATLGGTVTDQNGAVVPGAKITVVNIGTRLQREATTNTEGYFVVPLLPPSNYKVRVEGQGFTPAEIETVVLNVGDQKSLQIQLKAGDVSATVQVVNEAPLINESPAVGTVVDRQFVENLPLNGRSFQSLITLSPGVVLTKANSDVPGQFSVNGQRANANYFMIDGVGANIGVSPATNIGVQTAGTSPGLAATGGTNNLVSVDALQEFKILTSSFAPEFGRTPGGQIQILTRSGTNDFHGTLFEYFRNDALDANDWFSNSIGSKKAALRQNDFGGVLGGPLFLPRFGEGGPAYHSGKNRTFFFFSYEGLRLRLPNTGLSTVPSLAARSNAPVAIQPLLNALPRPNGNDLGNNLAQFNSTFSDPSRLDATSIRIDHAVSPKLTFFGRYNYSPSESNFRGGGGFALSVISTSAYKTKTLTGGLILLLSSSLSNDFRANYSTNSGTRGAILDDFGGAVPLSDAQIYSTANGSSDTGNFFAAFGSIAFQKGRFGLDVQRQINLVDTFTINKGNHQLKFGVDYRRLNPIFDRTHYSLQLSFTSVTTAIATGRGNASIAAFSGPTYPVFTNLSFFGQDVWKVGSRLTITYGSRWELNPPPHEATGRDPSTLIGINSPSTIAFAPPGTPLYRTTYNNFAPRIGVAYQIRQRPGSETIVRGGFGVFYDIGTSSVASAFGTGHPYFARKTLANVLIPLDAAAAAPPIPVAPFSLLGIIDPDLKLPYTLQWNLSVEQSLGAKQTISASYVAAVGCRLLRQETISNPSPTFSSIRLTRNLSTSDYQAAQLQFERRLSRGLQALASYTWSHSLDNASSDLGIEAPAFRIDARQERGPSDFDVRHAFNAGVTYDIPSPGKNEYTKAVLGNFSLNAIFTARTAVPVNVITGTNIIDGSSVSRPDLLPNIPLYLYDVLLPGGRRINPAAFTIPVGRQGTLGRNALRGFPLWQLDLALLRKFNLTERVNLQLKAELFNVFNHPNFADPVNRLNNTAQFGRSITMLGRSLGSSSGGLNPLYQVGGPRSMQLALRLGF